MPSTSEPQSLQEVDESDAGGPAEDPELGTEGDSEPPQDQLLIRQESNASSSSSSTSVSSVEESGVSYIATLVGSTANLCSATLGAGILALPYAFYQAGIICGLLLLLLSAWATFSSIELLAESLAEFFDSSRLSTYEKAVEKGLGRRFRTVVEISILVFCCGTAVGYVKAVGDIMERVVPYMTKTHEQMAMFAVWLIAMLPLSCLRRMKSLECASSVGIMSIGTLLVAAIVHLLRKGGGHDHVDNMHYSYDDDGRFEMARSVYDLKHPSIMSLLGPANGSWLSVLQACPIFFYAFSSQVNVAQIFEELPGEHGNNSQKIRTMKQVTFLGVFVCGLLYASLSLVTLIDFGDRIQPNVLSCYSLGSKGQPLLHVAFLGMALAVVIAFPLNIFPARVSLIQMWEEKQNAIRMAYGDDGEPQVPEVEGIKQPLLSKRSLNRSYSGDEADENNSNGAEEDPLRSPAPITVLRNDSMEGEVIEEFHCAQHTSLTLLLAGMALGLALIVPNISVVFGLLGGTTSSLLGFVVPGLLGLKMDRTRTTAWVLVIFGSLIGVMTTGATIHSMVHS